MKYAGFWIRVCANVIDVFATTVLSAAVLVIFFSVKLALVFEAITRSYFLFSLVFNWLYFACFESSSWQATPGKRLLGLRVADLTGARIGFGRATGRFFSKNISGLVFCIGYIMVGRTEKKQGLHDTIAGTLVLYGSAPGFQSQEAVGTTRDAGSETGSVVFMSSNSRQVVMAGFDENGHVIRLSFRQDDPRLSGAGLIIGRYAKSADLHIADTSVSRRHARIFNKGGGMCIEDLGSTNGISVNGQRVEVGSSMLLPADGSIVVGDVELSVGKY